MSEEAIDVLFALVERGEESFSVPAAWAALTAAVKGPIDTKGVLDQLVHLKRDTAAELPPTSGKPLAQLRALNHYFRSALRFHGNLENYQDPANSFIDDVLSRRLGIPISLSIIFMELADGLGLKMEPVSFPGHFLVREVSREILCDPFHGRIGLTRADCMSMASDASGRDLPWNEDYLSACSPVTILQRMLNNLRNSYSTYRDTRRLTLVEAITERLDTLAEPTYSTTIN